MMACKSFQISITIIVGRGFQMKEGADNFHENFESERCNFHLWCEQDNHKFHRAQGRLKNPSIPCLYAYDYHLENCMSINVIILNNI